MQRDQQSLLDIVDSIALISEYVTDWNDFVQSTKDQDAVIRRLTIVSEATKRLLQISGVRLPTHASPSISTAIEPLRCFNSPYLGAKIIATTNSSVCVTTMQPPVEPSR